MLNRLHSLFNTPKLTEENIDMNEHSGYQSDHSYEENAERIALENLRMQREALQHTLNIMHHTMLISILAVVVATIAVLVAVIK